MNHNSRITYVGLLEYLWTLAPLKLLPLFTSAIGASSKGNALSHVAPRKFLKLLTLTTPVTWKSSDYQIGPLLGKQQLWLRKSCCLKIKKAYQMIQPLVACELKENVLHITGQLGVWRLAVLASSVSTYDSLCS